MNDAKIKKISSQQKSRQRTLLILAGTVFSGIVSVASLASVNNWTWMGPSNAASYYGTSDQLHSAAPASSAFTIICIGTLVICICMGVLFWYRYKGLRKGK